MVKVIFMIFLITEEKSDMIAKMNKYTEREKIMKKLVVGLMVAAMAFGLTACGGSKIPPNSVHSIDNLPGKTIGVQLGTTGDIYASDYEEEGSTIERYNKGADAIQALIQGKVDCVIIDEQPANSFVEKNPELEILEEEFALEEYAICISKDNPELTAKINDALAQLEADGTLTSIIANYIGDETKGKSPYVSPEGVDRSNGTLVMATNAAFEPYEFYKDQKIVGIDADMAQAVCDILGMELKIEDMEFDSIINAVTSGKADIGVAGMTVTEERLQNVDFSEPYTTATQVIIVRGE